MNYVYCDVKYLYAPDTSDYAITSNQVVTGCCQLRWQQKQFS